MIKLHNIDFSYIGKQIFQGLNLNVSDSSWLGLIGPNGSGKTTLIKIISGLLHPNHGQVVINDKNLKEYYRKEIAQILAVVSQENIFSFSFTAFETVLMGRSPFMKRFGFETREDIQITKEVMQKTDTWQFRSRPIDELSGGERQRVLIARALAQKPRILLLDEPTNFLDIKHQQEIMGILKELNKKEDLTIISAIHDINLAISFCSEIGLISNGQLFDKGIPENVVTYANLKKIFETDVYVGVNEFTGKPYYVPK